jgi:hypothetical protein
MDYTQSGSYPLTCLAWVTLPGAYAPASIAPGVIRARKPPHPQHVLRQGGSPWGGLVILYMPNSLRRENSLINSPTELQYLILTLVFTVSAKTRARSALFRNLSFYAFLKYLPAHINEMFILRYRTEYVPVVKFHADCNRCQGFSNAHC